LEQGTEDDKVTEARSTGEIAVWGIIALSAWALAVLAANLGSLVPPPVYAALHASRADGGTVNQLRASVQTLEAESGRLRVQNTQLSQRLSLSEDSAMDLLKRVAAVEGSLPRIVETQSRLSGNVDGTLTSAIDGRTVQTFEAEGGSVAVETVPMVLAAPKAQGNLPMPAPLTAAAADPTPADGSATGLALDGFLLPNEAMAHWVNLQGSVGTMLVGLTPLLSDPDAKGRIRIIAGPVMDASVAGDLCKRLGQRNVSCEAVPYKGMRLVATK
jgi:hypothetical protein